MDTGFNTITKQTPLGLNFDIYNKLICDDTDFKLSQRNLIMMYSYLYIFIQQNLIDNLNTFLNTTTYFNKIIFLKYLNFFKKVNELQKRILSEKEKEKEAEAENTKLSNFKKQFISNTINLLINNRYIYSSDLATLLTKDTQTIGPILEGIDNIITTLFEADTIQNIYNTVITNIDNNPHNYDDYLTLFHLNNKPVTNSSSDKATFFIGFHGTLFTVVPVNEYLTIKTPVNTTINRWGIRGDPTKFFNSMKYTFKQCLLRYGENLDNFNANSCFELLGTSIKDFNYDTSQTTSAYCVQEPNNFVSKFFSNLTGFKKNDKIRIKHYSTDSYYFAIFNTDYTITDTLFINLSLRTLDKNIQYNTAENIINLNFLLFTNIIDFTVFNFLNLANDTKVNTFGLYSDIGLYTRHYLEGKKKIQSHLHDFYFPLEMFLFNTSLYIEDFVLERDIFALNNINIHLKYQDVDRSFVLLKGDSFSSNPYIIEYFIKTFNSKITIRPGPVLGNKEDEIFKENRTNDTTREHGATLTCLPRGLSCYKVTLSVLTNYEILQFCKDANINTCDLYDTSCQSFEYINDNGKVIHNYTPPQQQKQTLQRMSTYDDTKMLSKYDNLSDLLFNYLIKKPNFLVVGVDLKRKRGGRTKKRINNKKNSYKSKKNSRKQRKNSRKQNKYTNRITL